MPVTACGPAWPYHAGYASTATATPAASASAGSAWPARDRTWRQPTAMTASSPGTANSRQMTNTSGEMRNCTTTSPARTSPSRRTECSWRITISCSTVKRRGGITRTVTDTWPKTREDTMADE
jgi:hypothetical protein